MAPRDPRFPQVDFPQLIADIIEQLNITGQIGLLNFEDTVVPVYLIGQRDAVVTALAPAFTSAGVVSDLIANPAANLVLADTGQLAAGTYDVKVGLFTENVSGAANVELQHRNAANAANLASWPSPIQDANVVNGSFPLTFAYEIGVNERLRFQVLDDLGGVASRVGTWIMFQSRTVP